MSRYSIEGSTLTAIGDAIREKIGKLTRPGYVDSYIMTVTNLFSSGTQDYFLPAGTRKIKVKKLSYLFRVITGVRNPNNWVEEISIDLATQEEAILEGVPEGWKFTVYNNGAYGGAFGNVFNGSFEITCYDENGKIIQVPGEVINTITPTQMAEEVQNMLSPPPETAFTFTGNCKYKFSRAGWNWFLEQYSDKIKTENITDISYMFEYNPIEIIPMEINLSQSPAASSYAFSYCEKLKEAPVINNFNPNDNLFAGCNKLVSLNNNKFTSFATYFPCASMFSSCYCLRDIGPLFDECADVAAGNSIYGFYSVFNNCYVLDEVINLPYIYSTYSNSSYAFGSFVNNCYRLKELTFRGQVVTSGPKAGATLKLENYTGWSQKADLSTYGISNDKRVTDDASYQALKNDPDWWSSNVAYSRYNHDSAVNTINSLPDLSNLSYTNTISFKGAAGELTDGGAINTLTEEEIAVAAAKGWTVALT